MSDVAKITFKDKEIECPVIEGTEGELGIDISKLRAQSGLITVDNGFANTCTGLSAITFFRWGKGNSPVPRHTH